MRKLVVLTIGVIAGIASSAHAMKPGLWEVTAQMSGGGMPAMPAIPEAQRKQMEAMGIKMPGAAGGPMTVANKHCVT